MSGGAPERTRAGFVALAGRPNVGKSTLLNRIVGEKVAIASDKPQTTRRELRGIASGGDWQAVLVDLPGSQRPRDLLTARMQGRLERALAGADAALLVLSGDQGVGPGDRFLARALAASERTVIALNKVDLLDRRRTLEALEAAADLGLDADVFPVSARTGSGIEALLEHLVALLPQGPFLYPRGVSSDVPELVGLAELVREQVLLRTRAELPHAVEVQVEEIERRPPDLLVVRALVWTETESQKRILVGAGGRMVKAIGSGARREIERATGGRAHLDLSVKVRRGWRRDEQLLDRLGLE